MAEEKLIREGMPTPSEMITYAREYIRAYLDAVNEKAPEHLPPMAQQNPYNAEICLLPNGCYALILEAASEMKIRASFRNWEELQDIVVKGVDFFIGFFPHEMKSVADWKKRGRKDATRDVRLMSESQLGKAAGNLSTIIDEISRMASTNPWLVEKANEQISMLRGIEDRLRQGFAPIDAISTLQDLKAYKPTYEKMSIEFPDKSVLEKILEGVEELMALQGRMDTLESRMFEVEMNSTIKGSIEEELPEMKDKMAELEKSFEKVSNILQLLNTKVEKYFTKAAEADRLTAMEGQVGELARKSEALLQVVSTMQSRQGGMTDAVDKEIARLEEEIDRALRRVKRLERHFVDLAKTVDD